MTDTLQSLSQQQLAFAQEREWEQFHSPKNLASALIVEAGELLEHFQWMTEDQSRQLQQEKLEAVGSEMADVLLYLVQLSNVLGIDLVKAAQAKIKVNSQKYPVNLVKGSSKKYDQL
ncbi:nucleotide pyrophosphohydrolase [Ottowia thiooxydans]|uniref:nucleotide pyrophosphohydrolase n=1 Tax=Ottowia thiooxydans TaxID=219182 RepID=UPI000415C7D2|nr:nucleotide pyrophosphohydrolase [Ottowia thiooxydans]